MMARSPKTRLLFCEGRPQSLDALLLNRICPVGVLVVPARGKGSIARFVEGYLDPGGKKVVSGGQDSTDFKIFRDRDFDVEPPPQPALIRFGKPDRPLLLSYRTCVENYFLEGALIHAYWEFLHKNADHWTFGPSQGADFFEQCMEEAARALSTYQAVRWALTTIIPPEGWPSFGNSLGKKSNQLPTSLEPDACLQQAEERIQSFSSTASRIDVQRFRKQFEKFRVVFNASDFWDEKQYKIHFSGKDISRMIQKRQSGKIPDINGYYRWAIHRFDWRSHPDLLELSKEFN